MDTFERAYTTKEVSTTLEIGESTLRKWCLSLEKNGYQFIRNEQNKRLFVEHDLVVLRHFQKLVQEVNMPLENASMLVIDRFSESPFEKRTGIVPVNKKGEQHDLMRSDTVIEQLEKIDTLIQENAELKAEISEIKAMLAQQQKYIQERLEERDRKLIESIRSFQEQKQVLLEASTAKEKKGFFTRLFSKK
ncbi:MerR family transcriptional regulator [Aeribacillus pallidus]|uniref:DUF3967 domain-containing protein n=1 Tax=Aeribacillus TaxID=1055323 RepID=UPI0007B46AF4|nr:MULTISPECIES: MerR family transcriptional regulator [Aeribacillus]KZM53252.1 hypothetical protein A3Q35_17360 [Aeribacillus pallidus]MED0651871.1 MerR family transcriptional regulator [Aeribacillus composti]MED4485653.1 MerR family transcriptional regulator [Aeribacillus pallidus]